METPKWTLQDLFPHCEAHLPCTFYAEYELDRKQLDECNPQVEWDHHKLPWNQQVPGYLKEFIQGWWDDVGEKHVVAWLAEEAATAGDEEYDRRREEPMRDDVLTKG